MEISVCLIVKNEEKYLENCLESLLIFSPEIIVVDTGSKDSTKLIASKFMQKVYDFKWTGNYSDARNFSISKATRKWIMWLDADNYFEQSQAEKLKKILEKNNIQRYDVIFVANWDLSRRLIWSVPRIFKNNIGIKFKGKIHELPYWNNKKGIAVHVFLNHYRENAFNRVTKYYNILKKEYRNNKNDTSINRYLGEYYLKRNKLMEAEMHFKKVLKFKKDNRSAIIGLSKVLYHKQQYYNSIKLAHMALILDNTYPDIYVLIGNIYEKMGKIMNSITANKIALTLDKNFTNTIVSKEENYNFVPLSNLGRLYFKYTNIQLALGFYKEALKYADTKEKRKCIFKELNKIEKKFRKSNSSPSKEIQ